MLFNSFEFLLVFLPITFLGFFLIAKMKKLWLSLMWLIFGSLIFHAYWKASYTWLFVGSIVVNFLVGRLCLPGAQSNQFRFGAVVLGVGFNVALLGYFKYATFFSEVIFNFSDYLIPVGNVALPLAISFYTFQQISYLVDTYRGSSPRYGFLSYSAYLAFFPHLIAGPIVRHGSLISQLSNPIIQRWRTKNIAVGFSIILIGLFKKVVLADNAAAFVNPVFSAAANGTPVGFSEAWLAAILFSFVIYFDFSGYSDMAIGLARLFNIRFPENFASPYKAVSIIDFWRRWHITLSQFLRDYLYIPLGGNRLGPTRRLINLILTMLLGGLWHGAGWNFLLWGGLHGVYLAIAHVWRDWFRNLIQIESSRLLTLFFRSLTFLAVVLAWVFFRSTNIDQASAIFVGMSGVNGFVTGVSMPKGLLGNSLASAGVFCFLLLLGVNCLPNTQQFMRLYRPVLRTVTIRPHVFLRNCVWQLNAIGISFVVSLGMIAITQLENVQSFIYFRF